MATVRGPLHSMKSILKEAVVPKNKLRPRGNYTVGYARPPLATRFQPGRSGNPNGRPRKNRPEPLKLSQKLSPIHRAVLQCMLTPLDAGPNAWEPSTNLERMIQQTAEQAMAGDVRCMRLILRLYEEAQRIEEEKSRVDNSAMVIEIANLIRSSKRKQVENEGENSQELSDPVPELDEREPPHEEEDARLYWRPQEWE